ncbi:MAG: hypothetical protein R3B48_12595 [Kofleriaceae bacterium]
MLAIVAMSGALASRARAEELVLNERLWSRPAPGPGLSLSQQLLDQLTDLGNELGHHLDVLSLDLIALHFNGRARSMRLGVAAGQTSYLSFRMDSAFLFTDSAAKVNTRVSLGIVGRTLVLELPEFELAPASFRGERGVEVRLPLIDRRF